MAKTQIPAFLVEKFNSAKTPEERQEFIERYKNWAALEMTEDYLAYLEALLTHSVAEEDKENKFSSLFQSKYHSAYKKSERNVLRRLIKQIKQG